LAFMALGVKFLRLAEFSCRNGPDKLKKNQFFDEMELWSLLWPLKNFVAFFTFS
jgi:hypothetical protein